MQEENRMEQDEGFIETIINSLKYSVSDTGAFLWGGVAALLGSILVGVPFLFGYVTRCGREVLRGNSRLPAWDNLGELFKDGIMVIVIMAFYGLICGLMYLLIVPFFVAGAILGSDALLAAGMLMLAPALLISFAIGLLVPAAWVEYAVTGDVFRALNPVNALRLAAANPPGYIVAAVTIAIIQVILFFPSLLTITVPWVGFIGYASSAYIYARYYQRTMATPAAPRTNGAATAAV
jgi:hypothetical protein